MRTMGSLTETNGTDYNDAGVKSEAVIVLYQGSPILLTPAKASKQEDPFGRETA